VVFATYLGWLFIVSTAPDSPEWVHFGFSLLAATVLASAILALRVRTFAHLEELRKQDRVHQLELEASLSRTEAARRGEEGARVELERALSRIQESEGRFRRLAESTFEGVTIFQDDRIVDATERAGELFERSLISMIGKPIDDLVTPQSLQPVANFIRAAKEDTDVATRKIRAEAVTSGDDSFPVEISVSPASHQGRPGLVMLFRDITEQLQLEEVLRRAANEAEAQSRAKSAFLANMSHELRTPLNAVIGFANILIRNQKGNLSERDLEYLQRIESNGQHLLTLIGDVLDVSKIEAGRMDVVMEPVGLDSLIRESLKALEIQAKRRDLEILVKIPPDLEPVMADAQRLRQVLLNLIGNAVKFTPSGWVAVRVVAEEGIKRPLRIEVEDSGVGIPASEINSIFNPFRQAEATSSRRFGGTGLGLTISRSLCELMGFSLEVESWEGKGSLFSVLLHPVDAQD
jgi:PAS domain S-box-containing protein